MSLAYKIKNAGPHTFTEIFIGVQTNKLIPPDEFVTDQPEKIKEMVEKEYHIKLKNLQYEIYRKYIPYLSFEAIEKTIINTKLGCDVEEKLDDLFSGDCLNIGLNRK